MAAPILLADSVTRLGAAYAGSVVVTGSHGGLIAAQYAAQAKVRAIIFNDAGRGRDDAGIAGPAALERIGIVAAAVAHTSARIGDAGDTLAHGIVGAANETAMALGVAPGMPARAAAQRMQTAGWQQGVIAASAEARLLLVAPTAYQGPVWGLDSIALVETTDIGSVLVLGSHGALHGGDPDSALPVAARGAIFHDAGRGKDDAGVSRLPVLEARGIAAAAVDHSSARIGDARSLWSTGTLSVVNAVAAARGVFVGMAVSDAARAMRDGIALRGQPPAPQ